MEKLGVEALLPITGHSARSRVYGKSVSKAFLPMSMWVFFHLLNVYELLASFWIFQSTLLHVQLYI